jgi:alpha-amylase
MAETIALALGIHNHQPVGNFDFVFEEAYRKSYRPFLEVL